MIRLVFLSVFVSVISTLLADTSSFLDALFELGPTDVRPVLNFNFHPLSCFQLNAVQDKCTTGKLHRFKSTQHYAPSHLCDYPDGKNDDMFRYLLNLKPSNVRVELTSSFAIFPCVYFMVYNDSRPGYVFPYIMKMHSRYEIVAYFYPPYCLNVDMKKIDRFLSFGGWENAIFNCKPEYAAVFNIRNFHSFVRENTLKYTMDMPEPSGLGMVASYVSSKIFDQNCDKGLAVCYVLDHVYKPILFKCAPQCTTFIPQNYDIPWYERWYKSFIEYFSLNTLKMVLRSAISWIFSALMEVLSSVFGFILDIMPTFVSKVSLFIDKAIRAGFVEACSAFVYGYVSYNLFVAIVLFLATIYLKLLLYPIS